MRTVLFLSLFCGLGCVPKNSTTSDTSRPESSPTAAITAPPTAEAKKPAQATVQPIPAKVRPTEVMDVKNAFTAFFQNPFAAQKSAQGKLVKVEGIVANIAQDGNAWVVFMPQIQPFSRSDERGAYCRFTEPDGLERLKTWTSRATIHGTFKKWDADGKRLYLEDCQLTAVQEPPGKGK